MKDDPEAAQELGLTADVVPNTPVAESPEDRTSYQVARWLFDKGIRYSSENEKHIISLMDDAMRKLGMDNKSIRYNLSYDEDFIPDTLGELQHMEDAINELAEGSRDEDTVLPKMDKGNPPGGMIKQVAEMVKSFYNRNHKEQGLGPFPKGEEGVVIHVRKQLGDKAGDLAERFVSKLSGQADEGWKGQVAGGTVGTLAGGALGAVGGPVGAAFGSALGGALGGVAGDKLGGPEEDEDKPKEGADMDQIPAYVRKQKQQSQDTAQAATDKRNEKTGAKVWSNPRLPKESAEMESILKLAGLAK
jgi:hypothetical protein